MGKVKEQLTNEALVLAYEEGLLSEAEFDRLQKEYLRELFLEVYEAQWTDPVEKMGELVDGPAV